MHRYIIKRLFWMIPIVLITAVLVFTLMGFCPGDPASIILGASATGEALAAKRIELGLDQPYLVRLADFLNKTFVQFDFGSSWITSVSIKSEIVTRLPRTMVLAVATMLISLSIGVPLGIIAAVKQNQWQDNVSMAISLCGISIPDFWLALLLIILFSVKLNWLPPFGIGGLEYYILPAIAGGAGGIALSARQTRASMLDVIRADYITTARSKGVPEHKVILKHAFKNALIPIITMSGQQFGRLVGGTMIIETIFSIPGIGAYIITGVNNRDYPVVEIGAIFLAIVFSLCMLLVDLGYAAVDPRIRARYSSRKARRIKANG